MGCKLALGSLREQPKAAKGETMADEATKFARVAPYLMVNDGVGAIAFYKRAFAAEEGERYDYEGRVGHVSLKINGSDVMMSNEYPESVDTIGALSPKTLGGTTMTINLSVDDVDA